MPNPHYIAHLMRILKNLQKLSKRLENYNEKHLVDSLIDEVFLFSHAYQSSTSFFPKKRNRYLDNRLKEIIEIISDASPVLLMMGKDMKANTFGLIKTLSLIKSTN